MPEFELIDRNGNPTGERSHDPKSLVAAAEKLWPGESQDTSDHYEEPNGWDIQPT